MHAWKHWLMGAGFFGFGVYKLFVGGSFWLVGLCVGASFYLFYRALSEDTGAAADDFQLTVDFVRNPYETLFDEALGQLTGGDEEPTRQETRNRPSVVQSLIAELDTREKKSEDSSAFDPDAVIARYLANRPAEQPAPAPEPVRPVARGFGRKRA